MKYQLGNLFDAPKGTYLAHACNCMGSWRSGVALQFAERFPKSYEEYRRVCEVEAPEPGDVLICDEEDGFQVICLFTSHGYGATVDSPQQILLATKQALRYLPGDLPIHMPKINAGLFNVPWEGTAELLKLYDDLDITVWELSPLDSDGKA